MQRNRLGQDLGKDQQQQGHAQGRHCDTGIAEQPDQHAGRDRGGEDVDGVVAEQDGADQPFPVGGQLFDPLCPDIAVGCTLVHAGTGGGGQGRLAAGEEGRRGDQDKDGEQGQPEFGRHRRAGLSPDRI